MQIIRFHESTHEMSYNPSPCASCLPIIYQVILSNEFHGEPEHYFYDFTNNELAGIDAIIQGLEKQHESEKALQRDIMWDILCATETNSKD